MSVHKAGFTQRLALTCARHPWVTIALWTAALVVSAAVYLLYGDVFTSSTRFLAQSGSERAASLIHEHGGGGGSGSLAQAGASVQRLADGIGSAQKGAEKLASGSRKLSSGAKELERGLHKLAGGAGQVSAGTRRAGAGAASLSQGLAGASRGAHALSSGIAQAGAATGGFTLGLLELSRGGSQLAGKAGELAGGAAELSTGARNAAAGVREASSSASQLAGAASSLNSLVAAYRNANPEAANDATYQQIVALAAQLESGSSQLSSGLSAAAGGVSSVADGASRLAAGASGLASGTRKLSAGAARSATEARRLERGMGQLASGSAQLEGGLASGASGASALAAGSRALAAGSGSLASGASGAAAGASGLASGSGDLAGGARKLSKGLATASSGAGKLSASIASVGTLTSNDTEVVIVRSEKLKVDDPAFKREVLRIRKAIAALPPADVLSVLSRYDKGTDARVRDALTSKDRHATIMKVELASPSDEAANHMDGLYEIIKREDAAPEFAVAITGSGSFMCDAQALAGEDLRRGEAIGIPVALLILVVVFGALVAAGLPILLSLFSIVVALALAVGIGNVFELSIFSLNILTAAGLAVGIDYSLFVTSRYREERARGLGKMDAIAAASATASNAVFFSGMTVVLALVGMLLVPLSIYTSLGVGAMCAVVPAVAAALTLLPALLSLLGDRIDAFPVPLLVKLRRRSTGRSWWGRAAERTVRRPALSLVLVVLALLVLAAPAVTMRTGGMSASSFPAKYISKQGLDMLQRDFAAGMSEPVTVVVDGDVGKKKVRTAVESLITALDKEGRFTPTGVSTSADGKLAVVQLVQDVDATSRAAELAVADLRKTTVPRAFEGSGAKVYVGGTTASQIDIAELTRDYMPIVIGTVLSLSFILLLLAFRSIPVALTAIFMNLLSVGAAYGLLTFFFQDGWGARLLRLNRPEAIESWVPLLLFCVLFGLSMDYQVFLLSRVRERWTETGDTREAAVFGVQSTAGIITGAALIMVAVFAGMASGSFAVLQQLGFGLAVAVLLDAFLVRVFLAPSLIGLFGDRYWWMPRWLNWLPRIDIEGSVSSVSVAGGASAASASVEVDAPSDELPEDRVKGDLRDVDGVEER